MNKRVVFFHNTASEYRIPLFQELSRIYPCTFIFTRLQLSEKIYKNKLDMEKMKKIRYINLFHGFKAFFQIKNVIKDDEVKCVVVPTLDSFLESVYGYWIYLCAKHYKKKTIYFWEKWEAPINEQPYYKRVKNQFQAFVAKPIIRGVEFCLGTGSKACEYFINHGADKSRCAITYNTSMCPVCQKTSWRDMNNIPHDKKILLYFGRIIEKKGLRYLIHAMAQLPDALAQKKWLVVVGDGEKREEFMELARKENINNISWLGYVHPDHRYDYFSQCDIFILPTYYHKGSVEGWGLTINEAIQCGKICIATQAVGSAYDLINEKNGYIALPASVDSLVQAISAALNHRDPLTQVKEDERLMSLYNYENSAKEFVKHIEDVINDKEGCSS